METLERAGSVNCWALPQRMVRRSVNLQESKFPHHDRLAASLWRARAVPSDQRACRRLAL